jgi:hypothetical protein
VLAVVAGPQNNSLKKSCPLNATCRHRSVVRQSSRISSTVGSRGPQDLLPYWYRGPSGRDVKLTTHLQLVPRSRKRGSVHILQCTSSWRSAQLVKHRDSFTLLYLLWPFEGEGFCLRESHSRVLYVPPITSMHIIMWAIDLSVYCQLPMNESVNILKSASVYIDKGVLYTFCSIRCTWKDQIPGDALWLCFGCISIKIKLCYELDISNLEFSEGNIKIKRKPIPVTGREGL